MQKDLTLLVKALGVEEANRKLQTLNRTVSQVKANSGTSGLGGLLGGRGDPGGRMSALARVDSAFDAGWKLNRSAAVGPSSNRFTGRLNQKNVILGGITGRLEAAADAAKMGTMMSTVTRGGGALVGILGRLAPALGFFGGPVGLAISIGIPLLYKLGEGIVGFVKGVRKANEEWAATARRGVEIETGYNKRRAQRMQEPDWQRNARLGLPPGMELPKVIAFNKGTGKRVGALEPQNYEGYAPGTMQRPAAVQTAAQKTAAYEKRINNSASLEYGVGRMFTKVVAKALG